MRDPYERVVQELENDLADGLMTGEEFNAAMRDLRAEAREAARDAADEAYDRAMDGW